MSSVYFDNRERWAQLSDIDYLGAFTTAWLAFNAWYRNVYTGQNDAPIIKLIKTTPTPIRSKLVPLLMREGEEARQFRDEIGMLHQRLENYQVFEGRGTEKTRITLCNVKLRDNQNLSASEVVSGISISVTRAGAGNVQMASRVTRRNGFVALDIVQPNHDIAGLEAHVQFQTNLSHPQQATLRALYRRTCPVIVADLTAGAGAPIECGSYHFRCAPDDLFAGVVEVIYRMRCCLFHGELVPSREAAACYEPAYYLVRRFLQSIP